MSLPHFKTITEQVAEHLRDELLSGHWQDEMPGQKSLSKQLGVSGQTVELALQLLEKEGLLVGQGAGRRRRVDLSQGTTRNRTLCIKILLYEGADRKTDYLLELFHRLREAGHDAVFAKKTIWDLGMNIKRIARFVESTEADAWIVFAGPRETLEWFAAQKKPVFALAGRRHGIPIAGSGPDKFPAQHEMLRRLVELGHRRIVTLVREDRRIPRPALFERRFLAELESHGIQTGPYNLPNWKDGVENFHRCLDALFRHTPPTAILVDEAHLFIAAQMHLAHRGILAPRDVSLVCLDPNPAFAWCQPSIAHFHWEGSLLVRSITRWANNVARGIDDRRLSLTKAEFIEGGTVGPVTTER